MTEPFGEHTCACGQPADRHRFVGGWMCGACAEKQDHPWMQENPMTPPDRPAQPAPDLGAEAVAAMIERLQATPNWKREAFGGSWKDGLGETYDRAPFEAADMLRAMRDELANWRTGNLCGPHEAELLEERATLRAQLAELQANQIPTPLPGMHYEQVPDGETLSEITAEWGKTIRAMMVNKAEAVIAKKRVAELEAALRKIEAEDDQPECCGNGTTGTAYEPPECCNQPLYGIDRAKRIAAAALKGDPT